MLQASQEVVSAALSLLLKGVDEAVEEEIRDGRNGLERCDARAIALGNSINAVFRQATSYLATIKEERNALAAVHRLPTELLVDIFRRTLPDERTIDFIGPHRDVPTIYASLYYLGSVCKRWKTTIQAHPSFWNYVSIYARSKFNVKALSSYAPLNIDCYIPHSQNIHTKRRKLQNAEVKNFAEEIEMHVHRWNNVRIVLNEPFDVELFRVALQSSAPLLQSAWIAEGHHEERVHGNDTPEPLELFAGDFAALRSLRIEHVGIHWNPSSFSKLCDLSLSRLSQGALSFRQLLSLLRSCSSLRNLSLSDLELLDTIEEKVQLLTNLSYLTLLGLHELPIHATQLLLSQIPPLPMAEHLDLVAELRDSPAQELPNSFHAHLPTLRRIFEEASAARRYTRVTLGLGNSVFVSSSTSPFSGEDTFGCEIAFVNVRQSPTPIVAWLRDIVLACSTKVHLEFDVFPKDRWSILDHLQPVESMIIDSLSLNEGFDADRGRADLQALFEYLATPQIKENHMSWPFPYLRTLSLSIKNLDVPAFFTMLRRRYGPWVEHESTGLSQPIQAARLEEVKSYLYYFPDSEQEELRGILGEDVVIDVSVASPNAADEDARPPNGSQNHGGETEVNGGGDGDEGTGEDGEEEGSEMGDGGEGSE